MPFTPLNRWSRMPVPASPLTDAYARLTEAYPGLTVTELSPGDPAPHDAGWVSATCT